MREVVIAGYLRSAVSRSRPNEPWRDWFANVRCDEMFAELLPEILKRTGIRDTDIDDFIVGASLGVGENWTFGGRFPLFAANISEKITARFIDQQDGSSMAALHLGYLEIANGDADIVMLGGLDHFTRIPTGGEAYLSRGLAPFIKLFTDEKYTHWDMATTLHAGLSAEKLFTQTDLTRNDLDKWALRSQERARKALNAGFFKEEIHPIEAKQSDGSARLVDRDQSIREKCALKELAALKPVYKKSGVLTAGNTCPLSAGVSAMILMDRDTADKKGVIPLAVIRGIGTAGIDPTISGAANVPAIKKALERSMRNKDDIDYYEINEINSVSLLYTVRELELNPEKVNVMGGAIAIGHAPGATGIRLVGTLARILRLKNAHYGVASIPCVGGQGIATLIERI